MHKKRIGKNIDILYIHTRAFVNNDTIIPVGIIGLMNSIKCKKLGVLEKNLTDDLIKSAKVIVIDCYWYSSLYPVSVLTKRCKSLNPSAPIIIGGATATSLGEVIIQRFDCDFVIQGCADKSFKLLVKALLKGENYERIPNLLTKKKKNKISYFLNLKDYATQDYHTLDWFFLHKVDTCWLSVLRFCKESCNPCPLAMKNKKLRIKRQQVIKNRKYCTIRPASRLRDDLKHVCANNSLVSLQYHNLGNNYAKQAFSEKYNACLRCEFYEFLPTVEVLSYMLSNFKVCYFYFSTYKRISQNIESAQLLNIKRLKNILNFLKDKNCYIFLLINLNLDSMHRRYIKDLLKLADNYNIMFEDNAQWFIRCPKYKNDPNALEKEFKYFYKLSKYEAYKGSVRNMIAKLCYIWSIAIKLCYRATRINLDPSNIFYMGSLEYYQVLWKHYFLLLRMKLHQKFNSLQDIFKLSNLRQ